MVNESLCGIVFGLSFETRCMERTVAVFHQGAIAYYTILKGVDGVYSARMLKYNGSAANTPPQELHLQKEGRHWSPDNGAGQEMVDELGYAIEMQKDLFDKPLYHSFDNR